MKAWKNAEIVALNVEETANGWLDSFWENPLGLGVLNDNLKKKQTEDPTEPTTPSDNNDSINQQS